MPAVFSYAKPGVEADECTRCKPQHDREEDHRRESEKRIARIEVAGDKVAQQVPGYSRERYGDYRESEKSRDEGSNFCRRTSCA